jgi:hypothetical protein
MRVFIVLALTGALQDDSRIALVRVHGNHSITDAEVIEIAGISQGDPFAPEGDLAIEDRLLRSGKFETVEVRVRYQGLDDSGDVALVLVVREKPSTAGRLMVGPLIDWSDEYGVTLGGRVAVVDLPADGRLAFPMSWGGKRQAGIEANFGDARLELTRWRRVNPHFDVADNRLEIGGGFRARRRQAFFDVRGRWSDVDFGGVEERFVTLGARAVLDTRIDPTVPGDAFYLGVDWRRLFFLEGGARANVDQFAFDVRGYKRSFGQSLLAGQFYWTLATGAVPDYEQSFIGGGKTLRGTKPGRFIGDNAAIATVELRLPLTSPLSFGRGGVHFFYDAATVYDHGEGFAAAEWHHGVGTGLFFSVALVAVRLDVGWDLEGATRFHIESSMKF